MCGSPVSLEMVVEMFAGVLELVLFQDHIELLQVALGQLLRRYHLYIHVARLALPAALDQSLEDLGRSDFDVDNDGSETGLRELGRMVDAVGV